MSAQTPIYVITATYNEAENLPIMVQQLMSLHPRVHLIVVDDSSPDGTGQIAERLAEEHPSRLTVIHRESKLGYASAQQQGIRTALRAGAEVVVTMDADLSHNPQRIAAMLQELSQCDVVVGSRYVEGGRIEGWNWFRHCLSQLGGRLITRLLTGLRVNDCTSGFRAYRAAILRKVELDRIRARGYGFLVELLFRTQQAGARIAEIPITVVDRRAGQSKLSKRIVLESALLCLRLLWERIICANRATTPSGLAL